jgi:hypothetical protein
MGTTTAALVAAYARRTGALPGVSSPLGCWLLLALLAPHAPGASRPELEAVLGTSAADARARAVRLLTSRHPAVGLAVGMFWDSSVPGASAVARALPASVATGRVPAQTTLDTWTREHSYGLLEKFPLEVGEDTLLLLASVLATDISWVSPLKVAGGLGGELGAAVSRCLRVDEHDGLLGLVETRSAGLVAVAAPESSSDLRVLSVIAAPEVAAAGVLAGAHEAALLLAGHESEASLVDATGLGDGHAWTVTASRERRVVEPSFAGPLLEWEARLPAWELTGVHDLSDAPGVPIAFETMRQFTDLPDEDLAFAARQAAVASYTATGFRAAAVTAVAMFATGAPIAEEVEVRRFLLRFNRPHAVVAACTDVVPEWDGVPVFSAWVDRAVEA